LVLATILAVRAFDAWRAPPLKLWHTFVPHELDARQLDAADWAGWLAAEDAAFDAVRAEVTDKLPAEDHSDANRFFADSPTHSANFTSDWNRSYVLMPKGTPRGAVVLLHGLTDSPYSLRHIALRYRELGFVAVGIRMPGHGTVPGALTAVRWEDWSAAARLAVRRARELAGGERPLHLVGYSNGGALAIKYALDALADPKLARPDQIVLISPMIGITTMARFAGVLGWPAVFPAFAKAAWLDIVPEYNPFKYNSFPVNGARQSSQLVRAVQSQIAAELAAGRLGNLPPVLTFQSTLDATVSTRAIFATLYDYLPHNGNEIVLFDRNGRAEVSPLMRPEFSNVMPDIVPHGPRRYSLTVVTNASGSLGMLGAMEAQELDAKWNLTQVTALSERYPPGMYSLSHVALPFPPDDALYGYLPSPDDFGVRLGTVAVRGERGTLIVNAETLMRASCNPFFGYMMARIEARITSASRP
jgi:alpha-beta hydrolase superfamily lysophospholipase